MELKRRFKDHPKRNTLETTKPLSYWSTSECLEYANILKIDYSDLAKEVEIKLKKKNRKQNTSGPTHYIINLLLCENSENPVPFSIFTESSVTVDYLKKILYLFYNQPEESKQTLWYNDEKMKGSCTLTDYFVFQNCVTVTLIKDIEVDYEDDSGSFHSSIIVPENIVPNDLLKAICRKENLDYWSHDIFFCGNFISSIEKPICALGIIETTKIKIWKISDLFQS